jgi:hypothetical protein
MEMLVDQPTLFRRKKDMIFGCKLYTPLRNLITKGCFPIA